MEKHFGPAYDPASEILVTVGVSEAIDVALRALLNPVIRYYTTNPAMYHMHLA